MRRLFPVLFSAAVVLLSAGCGSGGGGDKRLSRPEFQRRANQICTDLSRRERPDLNSTSKAGVDRILDRLDGALNDLARLNPPAPDEARYRTFLDHFRRGVDFAREKEPLLITLTRQMRAHPSDSHTTARYDTLVRPFVEDIRIAGENAVALGLASCARGLGGSSG